MNFPYIDDDEDDGYSSVDSYDWSDGEQVGGAEHTGAEAAEGVGAEAESAEADAEAEHTEVAKETYKEEEKRTLEEFLQDLNKYLEDSTAPSESLTWKRIMNYIDNEKEDIRKVLAQEAVQNDAQDDAQDAAPDAAQDDAPDAAQNDAPDAAQNDAPDDSNNFDSLKIKDLENSKFHLVLKKVESSVFDIENEIDTFMQEKLEVVVKDINQTRSNKLSNLISNNRKSYMKFERKLDNELYSRIMNDIFVIHVVGLNDTLKGFIDTVVQNIVDSISRSENIHKILIKCWECKGSKKLGKIESESETTCEFKYEPKPFPRTPMNSDENRYIVLLFKDIFEDDSTYDKSSDVMTNFVNLDFKDSQNRQIGSNPIISFDDTNNNKLNNKCPYTMGDAEGNSILMRQCKL